MPVYGDGRKQVLVVGEAPGEKEDEENRPFIGKSGQFLRDTLEEFGIDLDKDAWTTNSLVCHPPRNATPDAKQISYCRPNLLNAIAKYKPRTIITLGRSALVSVMASYWDDVKALEAWIGWRIPIEKHWICPTYHPSYLLRMKNPLMDRLFANHLCMAFEIRSDSPKQQDFRSAIEIIYDEDGVVASLAEMDQEDSWVAVDYEGNCLKPEYPRGRIVSCAISNGIKTISYPWRGKTVSATGEFLKSKRTRKIASNMKHEERWTRKAFGHGVRNWGWDTMLAAHCLDNREGITSLKFQSLVKLGVPVYNSHIAPHLNSGGGFYNRIAQIAWKDLLFYGGMDALLEHRLAMIQRKEMGYEES